MLTFNIKGVDHMAIISDSDENDSTTIEAIIKAWDDAHGYTYEEE